MHQQCKIKQISSNNTEFKQNKFKGMKNNCDVEQIVCQNPHNFSFGGKEDSEPEFGQFLKVTHQRINQSANDSQSQIVQQISIDWDQDSQIFKKKYIFEGDEEKKCQKCEKNEQIRVPDQLIVLSELKNLQDFLKILELINPQISKQMETIINENNKLKYENGLLKYKQSKATIKIQLYQNQLQVADKKYAKLLNDIQYLTNQKQYKVKSNKNLKIINDQLDKKSAKISLFCNQNCCNKIQTNNQPCYQHSKCNVEAKVNESPPIKKNQFKKPISIQQTNRKDSLTKEPQFKTKISPSKQGSSAKISISTKNSLNTKRLSSINQSDYNFIVSSIFKHKYIEKSQQQKAETQQTVTKYENGGVGA